MSECTEGQLRAQAGVRGLCREISCSVNLKHEKTEGAGRSREWKASCGICCGSAGEIAPKLKGKTKGTD